MTQTKACLNFRGLQQSDHPSDKTRPSTSLPEWESCTVLAVSLEYLAVFEYSLCAQLERGKKLTWIEGQNQSWRVKHSIWAKIGFDASKALRRRWLRCRLLLLCDCLCANASRLTGWLHASMIHVDSRISPTKCGLWTSSPMLDVWCHVCYSGQHYSLRPNQTEGTL